MSDVGSPRRLEWLPAREQLGQIVRYILRRIRRLRRRVDRTFLRSGRASPKTDWKPVGIRPGQYFAPGEARRLPIVVIVATGLRDGDAEKLAGAVEQAQMMTGTFRPLFVVDTADFGPFRHRGYVVERVMQADELAAVNPDDNYGEYLYARLRSIARDYRAASVVPIPEGSLDTMSGRLFRLIGAVPPGLSHEIQAAT